MSHTRRFPRSHCLYLSNELHHILKVKAGAKGQTIPVYVRELLEALNHVELYLDRRQPGGSHVEAMDP